MTEKILTYNDLMITPGDVYEQMGYHGEEPDSVTKAELTPARRPMPSLSVRQGWRMKPISNV